MRFALKSVSLLTILVLLTAPFARAELGDLRWEDQFDLAGRSDTALKMALQAERVFVVGASQNAAGNFDFIVRAHDARTGALAWQDVVDKAGLRDVATDVVTAGDRVVVGGETRTTAGNDDLLVRTYHAESGELVWEDQFDLARRRDGLRALAIDAGRVFAAGHARRPGIFRLFLLRAYDAHDGSLLWQDEFAKPLGEHEAFAVAAHGGRAFAYGAGRTGDSCQDFLRGYDARTGALLWEKPGACESFAQTMTAEDDWLVIAGQRPTLSGSPAFLVQAYDARTGILVWEDVVDMAPGFAEASAVAVHGGLVFVGGFGGRTCVIVPFGDCDFLIRTYDARTGTLLWAHQVDEGGGPDNLRALAVHADQVMVAGTVMTAAAKLEPLIQIYAARTGELRWESQTPDGYTPAAVALHGEHAFVAGEIFTPAAGSDFLVRAYEAR